MNNRFNTKLRFCFIPFEVLSITSEEVNTSFNNLNIKENPEKNWESSKLPEYPITIIIKLKTRVELDFILIKTKKNYDIDKINFFITDSLNNSNYIKNDFYLSGTKERLTNSNSQIKLRGVGNIIKLVIYKERKKNNKNKIIENENIINPYNKVGIDIFRIWAREAPLGLSKIENFYLEKEIDKVSYDRVLIELGVDIVSLNYWERFDNDFFSSPVDLETRESILCILKKKEMFLEKEDFLALKQVKNDLKKILELGKNILDCQKNLEFEIVKENYGEAQRIKEEILELKKKRDNYDVIYETSRYEKMIVMGSFMEEDKEDIEFKRKLLEREKRQKKEKEMREEILRKRKEEMKKNNYRDIITPEKSKKYLTPKKRSSSKKIIRKPKKKSPKKILKNQGDLDLQKYFTKIKENNSDDINSIPIEILSNLKSNGLLNLFGYDVWSSIFNSTWRARKSAAEAVLKFSQSPILEKYKKNKLPLFIGCCEISRMILNDKVPQNYLIALKILETCFNKPICDDKINKEVVCKYLSELLILILNRITGINLKIRDQSLNSLLFIFSLHPNKMDLLINQLLSIMTKNDKINPHKFVLKKLEEIKSFTLIGYMCLTKNFVEFFDNENFLKLFQNLVIPCLYHDEWELKKIAGETCISFYKKFPEVVLDILNQQNLKSSIMDFLDHKIKEVNQKMYLKSERKNKKNNERDFLPLKEVPEEIGDITESFQEKKKNGIKNTKLEKENFNVIKGKK